MAANNSKDLLRKLKIKTSTLQRLLKERDAYKKEEAEIEQTIEKMKSSNADPYDIKKQNEVLQETQKMVPDTLKRINSARDDVNEFIVINTIKKVQLSQGIIIFFDFKKKKKEIDSCRST